MLITLEGLDGSGKSSCVEALQTDVDAVFTREPTDSWYGDAVQRSIDDDNADPLAELFLYVADHAAHLRRTVTPALSEGKTVISDRYSDSRFAYQGATLADRLPDSLAYVRELHEPWTRPPDATIYLDVDPKTATERSGATNKFEAEQYLETVRENYERLIAAEPERFVRVDATQPQQVVEEEVRQAVETLLAE
ncbi:dTMP kinase [Halovenus halobia]|uniref:dTMP kinase n=1 Tax=Halovenus halobia TaxID=3396622 RepID=UPI003F563B05